MTEIQFLICSMKQIRNVFVQITLFIYTQKFICCHMRNSQLLYLFSFTYLEVYAISHVECITNVQLARHEDLLPVSVVRSSKAA